MPLFTKESLEHLREKSDLVELLSSHIDLRRGGASYKALCPFHEEKSPSFTVKRGDSHYHCYGCGAHGDAISFLMEYLNLSFVEAVENLAEKFRIPLEYAEPSESSEKVNKAQLREILEFTSQFYHACLLHTKESEEALAYLYHRHFTVDFIRRYQIGYAPKDERVFYKLAKEKKWSEALLIQAGLIGKESQRPFFKERITFPLWAPSGGVIGFSARKIHEETYGGKYINSPETPLFKKSRHLFGFHQSRRKIAKERKAILVEGQIDCLRMISRGFDYTVAALGTAFGEEHVGELLKLGVRHISLLFDADEAGKTAAIKVGDLFQSVGVEVFVVSLPQGYDPDAYLLKFGEEKLQQLLTAEAKDYLTFRVQNFSKIPFTPASKTALARELAAQISAWKEPVMVHESLRKAAALLQVPEEMLGQKNLPVEGAKKSKAPLIDPHRVLELDLLRWLLLMEDPTLVLQVKKYLTEIHFWTPICRKLFSIYIDAYDKGEKRDLLSLFIALGEEEAGGALEEILQKKIHRERAQVHLAETIQKILDRQWMREKEEIRKKIHRGGVTEEEVFGLAKEFDALQKSRPLIKDN